jgi:hypothetical protein
MMVHGFITVIGDHNGGITARRNTLSREGVDETTSGMGSLA